MNFIERLNEEIYLNIGNYQTNIKYYDYSTFSVKLKYRRRYIGILARKLLNALDIQKITTFKGLTFSMLNVAKQFEYLYNILEDAESKELLVRIAVFRILTDSKVRLPLQNDNYWNNVIALKNSGDYYDVKIINHLGKNIEIPFFDLASFGYDIGIYYNAFDIASTFLQKQYEYYNKRTGKIVSARNNDTVIDGGGCWGDTALFFASKIKANKIYSFEFIPQNLKMFGHNLDANPKHKNRITIVKHPLWSESGIDVYYNDWAGASTVSFDKPSYGCDGSIKTVSIDDFVQSGEIDTIGFIKLDTEGAELEILKGAVNTLLKDKPRLAIALYHRVEDFDIIPKFLSNLNLGYKFYLGHHTPGWTETVLYCEGDES